MLLENIAYYCIFDGGVSPGWAELQGRASYFSPDLRHRCNVA